MSAFEDDCIQSVGQWNRLQAQARRGGGGDDGTSFVGNVPVFDA